MVLYEKRLEKLKCLKIILPLLTGTVIITVPSFSPAVSVLVDSSHVEPVSSKPKHERVYSVDNSGYFQVIFGVYVATMFDVKQSKIESYVKSGRLIKVDARK